MSSVLLDRETAAKAVELVMPAILAVMRGGHANREMLHIVIGDPSMPYLGGGKENQFPTLYEESVGDPDLWPFEFSKYAHGKADLSWRTGLDSMVVRDQFPFLYQADDPPYGGSVYMYGFVVSCSGVEGYWDATFSRWIAEACRALCLHKMATDVLPSDRDTVGT